MISVDLSFMFGLLFIQCENGQGLEAGTEINDISSISLIAPFICKTHVPNVHLQCLLWLEKRAQLSLIDMCVH